MVEIDYFKVTSALQDIRYTCNDSILPYICTSTNNINACAKILLFTNKQFLKTLVSRSIYVVVKNSSVVYFVNSNVDWRVTKILSSSR